MKFQDIYHFLQAPPPIYLGKEVAVCYVLAALLKQGDSYGAALAQQLETDYPMYRLSDTVLYSALKFLDDEGVIDGYWQKNQGKGRPRKVYHIHPKKHDFAQQYAQLWYKYLSHNRVNIHEQSG